jgi:hypothetical protein
MTTPTLDDVLSQATALKPEEQLLLLARLAEHVRVVYSEQPAPQEAARKRSILDLEGVGAEIWRGIDAQEYVNRLRDEWDERS